MPTLSADGVPDSVILAVLISVLMVVMVLGLVLGFAPLSLGEVLVSLVDDPETSAAARIVQEIRLPRVLVGALFGATLAMSGAALQGLLRNPLADPGVIGVSASASLGAVVAIYYGVAAVSPWAVPGFAMTAALISTSLLYVLARRDTSVLTLILVGIGLTSIAGALTSLAMNLAPNPFSLSDMVLWLLGSLSNRSFADVALFVPFMTVGVICLLFSAPGLRYLTLGEDVALTAGVALNRVRSLVIVGSALAVGAGVAVTGSVGFVGLIVPHMVRPFVGNDPARLLIPSALAGACLVVLADVVIRLTPTDTELKLGVVTALIGGPFFVYLVIKTRRALR